jgi:hypothetical protein
MSKFELTKTIEARKLNPRTRIPTTGHPVTIPFGAIVQDAVQDRDVRKFTYLGDPYQCPDEMFRVCTVAIAETRPAAKAEAQPAPAPEAAAEESRAAEGDGVAWEQVPSNWLPMRRAKVAGGWLVALGDSGAGLVFYADPKHQWRPE